MNKLNNSDFESLENIIKSIDFDYNPGEQKKEDKLADIWKNITGEKISEMTKVIGYSKNTITVSCCDSYVANELYNAKEKLIKLLMKDLQQSDITVTDIKFEYKTWNNSKK